MSNRIVKLAVVTDFVCPSCFVVQHELLTAMSYCKDTLQLPIEFQYQHLPFRLIATKCLKPGQTIEKTKLYNCHLGEERAASLRESVTKWGEEKSIPITWEGVIGQTTTAHRLCAKAAQASGQETLLKIIKAIFDAHVINGKDISDPNILAEIAESVGLMPKDKTLAFLASQEMEDEVTKIAEAARAKGITGVPLIVIDGKWAVSGGQSSDVFIQIFKKLAASGTNADPSHLPGPAVPTQICA